MSKKTDKLDEKIKLLTAVRNNKPAVATDETEKPDFKKPLHTYGKIQLASSDATSIKGKIVDDSNIEDGKSLVYSGKKDKIVYERVRHSGGVAGAGTGDMTKVVYDPDADNVVESADNADTVDGSHGTDLEKTVNKNGPSGYCGLDGSSLIPLARIPATLTGKDADTVDGSHGVALEKVVNKAAASGYCDLDAGVLVPLARLPATLTGKDADSVDGVHAAGFLQGTWTSGTCTVAKGGTTPHGLGGTPSLVFPSVNALQPYIVVWTADNTNITFYHNAAATLIINWLARL
jgi:hypothetical protein